MTKEYVTQHAGGYRIAGTRVSLDSVVYAFRRGASPESIGRSFSTLTHEQVYGAIAYYLAHEAEIDEYLRAGEVEYERLRRESSEQMRRTQPELMARLDARRKEREAVTR